MTTSNDDQTTQLPEVDETMPLPTTPAPSIGAGQDATTEMPASSPDLFSDPLAVFRDAPTTQMPADPFRADAGAEGQAGASGAQGAQAQAGSVGTGGRTAFDPASTGETTPRGHEAGAASGAQTTSGTAPGAQTWSAQSGLGVSYPLPEAPRRGVRVGSFVWALLVCMVGAFLITEAYITNLNLPVIGISAIALLGVILILTALFSGRSKKTPKQGAGTPAVPNPADAIRRD